MARPAQSLETRFHQKVELIPFHTCWEWIGYKDKNGFGQINLGKRGAGIDYAHRVSYELHVGPIEEGHHIIQTCHNRSCVNPYHLYSTKDQKNHLCTDVKTRLLSRIQISEKGCWEYQACKAKGYGRIGYGLRERGVQWAHILSWEVHYGEIPKGLFVLHKCDNPPCVNPDHLFLGTQTENIEDCISKGRMWYQN